RRIQGPPGPGTEARAWPSPGPCPLPAHAFPPPGPGTSVSASQSGAARWYSRSHGGYGGGLSPDTSDRDSPETGEEMGRTEGAWPRGTGPRAVQREAAELA
ncbi:hypothetical protein K5549_018796, partial [Capra hircus]